MLAFVAVAALTLGSQPAPAAKPEKIMSMNLCTDALLLDLVPLQHISSVSYLSRSSTDSYLADTAARVPVNHGLAEEVLAEKPDLVLAGTYTTTGTRALLKRLGMPLLEVPPANSFEEIRVVTRGVARAVGETARGEELLARMDATLQALQQHQPDRAIRVVAWDGGGSVPGEGTLFDAILRAAGGVNIAAEPGLRGTSFGIERLLSARPDVLSYGEHSRDTPGLRTDVDQHPLILALYANRRVTYPELLFSCGVPQSAEAAKALRAQLLAAMARPGPIE
jgi:iron complex transport system substrate-binding protein